MRAQAPGDTRTQDSWRYTGGADPGLGEVWGVGEGSEGRGCTWRAAGDSLMTSAASLRALEARCSPSAAITLARASRAASASAAMARCSCTGRRTSLLQGGGDMTRGYGGGAETLARGGGGAWGHVEAGQGGGGRCGGNGKGKRGGVRIGSMSSADTRNLRKRILLI